MYPRTFLITKEISTLEAHTCTSITNKIVKASTQERERLFNRCLNILQKEYLNEQTSPSNK